jgi:hypothetical protein
MAFENVYSDSQRARVLKLDAAIEARGLIPAYYLMVSMDHQASTAKKKVFALFYDREAHQKTFASCKALQDWHGARAVRRLQDFVAGFSAAR